MDANGFVPFAAAAYFPGVYPGWSVPRRHEDVRAQHVTNQLSMQGWQSGRPPRPGIKAAGNHPTQQNVIAQTNRMTDFTSGGISGPSTGQRPHHADLSRLPLVRPGAGHVVCAGDIEGHQVFICFGRHTNLKDPTPVAPRPGTPGT